jgi:rubrerythrin
MSEKEQAPFTPEQVEALNAFQNSGQFHPFTCGGNRTDEAHTKYQKEHGGDFGQLVATEEGWVCPVCGYTQNWAHSSMVELGQKQLEQPNVEI